MMRALGEDGSCWEQLAFEEPWCDYCERYGHTFRSCPQRDDTGPMDDE